MTILEKKETGAVISHVNGQTINEIVKAKLAEPSDSSIPPQIQGEEMDGQFDYNKAHIAALVQDKPGLEQSVTILHAESPCRIFVCPNNQIGLADQITNQVAVYASIDETMVGFSPGLGKLCLAKSKDDDAWYRAACLNFQGDEFNMFFADFGFCEVLPRDRLKVSGI